jgi:hypothetical protein
MIIALATSFAYWSHGSDVTTLLDCQDTGRICAITHKIQTASAAQQNLRDQTDLDR